MKRVMLMMVLAALLLTQCKKPSIEFPTPSVTTTVNMTITAGPGSKTDITTAGHITWSEGDKIYVGDGSEYVGYLTLVSGGGGDVTGTFTGNVTVDTGDDCTFHFYYLGHDNDVALADGATKVTIDFSSQNIYADGGKLKNASGQHVGYGKVEGVDVEADKPITGLQVSMKSKVAIAYFSFTKVADGNDYTGALTLSGEQIYNKMTVNFSGDDFEFSGTKGCIRLAGDRCERYAMLVPAGTSAATLNFGDGDVTGATALENGIEANKFYRIDGNMPIEVEMKPVEFTVAAGTKVKFAPGNLYYDADDNECHWKFESNQCDFRTYDGLGSCIGGDYSASGGTPPNDWGLFGWSGSTGDAAYGKSTSTNDNYYSGDFEDWGGITDLPDNTGGETWRTLSSAEWAYLLNTGGSSGRTDENRFAKAKVNYVPGLLIFPDGYNNDVRIPDDDIPGVANVNDVGAKPAGSIPADIWAAMESSGVVFLPAAGYREGTSMSGLDVNDFSSLYWSSTPNESKLAYNMGFELGAVVADNSLNRHYGCSVRLVRSAS